MTADDPDLYLEAERVLIREDFANGELWTQQSESELLPPYTLEELLAAAELELAGDAERPEDERGVFVAAQRVLASRERDLVAMGAHPMTRGFVPDDFWLMLRELCRLRVRFPGRVLSWWLSGGIRAGKSHLIAGLVAMHWLYYRVEKLGNGRKGSSIFACVGTKLEMSPLLQQRPMVRYMPAEAMGGEKGSVKQDKDNKLNFKGGRFTDDRFLRYQTVEIEGGEQYLSGGECTFWADTQVMDENAHIMQGIEATMAWLDEGKNPAVLKAARQRVISRATRTRERWHRELMVKLQAKLEKLGRPDFARPTPYELGNLMLGVVVNTYTPRDGWNQMVADMQKDAEFPEAYQRQAPELVGKPGVLDASVPVIGFPKDETCLIGYLHTSQNRVVDSYTGLSADLKDAPEAEVRKLLYGWVSDNSDRSFYSFGAKHLCDWGEISRDGTLYEVIDFGAVKPPSIMWVLADKVGHLWQVQEWPCEAIPIEINGRPILPGAWAVSSQTGRLNGDEGPAYKLRLGWNAARMVMEIWRLRQRLMEKLAETGSPFVGKIVTEAKAWKTPLPGQPATVEGPFAMPHLVIADPRGVKAALDGARVGDAYEAAENGIIFDKWDDYDVTAPNDADGQRLILEALAQQVHGGPRLRINRECTNTRFMFNTYTVPPYREGPTRKDEACVEWFDLWKYLLRWQPVYVDSTPHPRTGMSFGVTR